MPKFSVKCVTAQVFGRIRQRRTYGNCNLFRILPAELSSALGNTITWLHFWRVSLCWLSVKDQLYYRQPIMAFKCMTGQDPDYLTSQFITREQVSQRTTRSSQKLNIPLFRTASGQRTFHYRAMGLWNNLESHFKTCRLVDIFKR